MRRFDVRIDGAGIVGRSLALSLASLGLSVALHAPRREAARTAGSATGGGASDDPSARADLLAPARGPDVRALGQNADVRAYALSGASVALLERLKVWPALRVRGAATPVYDMRVHGDAGASMLAFSAWEQRAGELAFITDAAAIEAELDAALSFAPHVTRVDAEVPAVLVAHCEGRHAIELESLGAGFERIDYGQRAIAARVVAERPHRHVARQWFRSPDVLALLPFDRPEPGRSYALVWSLPNARAAELEALDDAAFADALNDAIGEAAPAREADRAPARHDAIGEAAVMHGARSTPPRGDVGRLRVASARASWPLVLGSADAWCGPGWVLVGDAAHVVHPLAGQGLNLGLADVAVLADEIARREPWRSLADERLLRRYVRRRAAPTWAMARITDGLLRLFAGPSAPVRELRNNGLALVDRLSPLKRWLTARALDS